MARIFVKQMMDVTPEFLAEIFCELDNSDQADFLAATWRFSQSVWENPDRQWEAIADVLNSDGKKFVEELANRID